MGVGVTEDSPLIYLAIAELVVIVALLARGDRAVQRLIAFHLDQSKQWADERSELVTRAMHPQVVLPPARMQPAEPREPQQADEFELAGKIIHGSFGEDDPA